MAILSGSGRNGCGKQREIKENRQINRQKTDRQTIKNTIPGFNDPEWEGLCKYEGYNG